MRLSFFKYQFHGAGRIGAAGAAGGCPCDGPAGCDAPDNSFGGCAALRFGACVGSVEGFPRLPGAKKSTQNCVVKNPHKNLGKIYAKIRSQERKFLFDTMKPCVRGY